MVIDTVTSVGVDSCVADGQADSWQVKVTSK
jgi:hypothetical protein